MCIHRWSSTVHHSKTASSNAVYRALLIWWEWKRLAYVIGFLKPSTNFRWILFVLKGFNNAAQERAKGTNTAFCTYRFPKEGVTVMWNSFFSGNDSSAIHVLSQPSICPSPCFSFGLLPVNSNRVLRRPLEIRRISSRANRAIPYSIGRGEGFNSAGWEHGLLTSLG